MNLAETLREQEGLSAADSGGVYAGTRGEYSFLYLANTGEVVVSVVRGEALPDRDELRAFAKSRPELSGCKVAGTRVNFTLRSGTAKHLAERLHTLLPELLAYLHDHGYQNCCELSRAAGGTVACMAGSSPRLVSYDTYARLAREAEQNQRTEDELHENIPRGVLGALAGGLIGAAAIVLLGRLGYVAALSGMVLGYCTIGGYRRGAGKLSAAGIAVSVAVMILAVYLGNRVDIAFDAVKELDLSFAQAFAWMHELVDADAYTRNLVVLYLFSAIGAVPAALSAHRIAKEKNRVYRIGE